MLQMLNTPPPHTHSTLEAIKCDVSKKDVLKFPGDTTNHFNNES